MKTLKVAHFFDGENWHQQIAVSWQQGTITAISALAPGDKPDHEGLMVPGFVDVQVNGGGGVLFNQQPQSQALQKIVNAHLRYGTTSMLPTVISDSLTVMQDAADAVATARRQEAVVAGIHFEGPHLSEKKRGVHPASCLRPLSQAEMALFCRTDLGQVVVTLAPEVVPPDQVRQLVAAGVRVCLGHSNASAGQVMQALAAGATGFTHLFNAMSPLQSRAPGMVGAALADDNSYCGLITDFHHVHPLVCKLAIKAKGHRRIMLVTDAMAHVGTKADSLDFFDTPIRRQGDKLTIADGTLAGSVLDMLTAVRHCHEQLQLPLDKCLQMAARVPADFLGRADLGRLRVGSRADFVLLDDELRLCSSWVAGEQRYSQQQEES